MASLRAYQEEFKRLVFPSDREATGSSLWGTPLPGRLDVYRNNARSNWADTLGCDFALTKSQFDADAWRELQRRFFAKPPPQHWELNRSVEPFVRFLAGQNVPAYVRELAD